MNSLFFVVCIVAIVFCANVVTEYLKTRATKEERGANAD